MSLNWRVLPLKYLKHVMWVSSASSVTTRHRNPSLFITFVAITFVTDQISHSPTSDGDGSLDGFWPLQEVGQKCLSYVSETLKCFNIRIFKIYFGSNIFSFMIKRISVPFEQWQHTPSITGSTMTGGQGWQTSAGNRNRWEERQWQYLAISEHYWGNIWAK